MGWDGMEGYHSRAQGDMIYMMCVWYVHGSYRWCWLHIQQGMLWVRIWQPQESADSIALYIYTYIYIHMYIRIYVYLDM